MKVTHKFKFTLILALFNMPLSFYAMYLYAPSFEIVGFETGGGD